MIKFFFK